MPTGCHDKVLKYSQIDTVIGTMVAISDERGLYFLKFADEPNIEHKIKQIEIKTKSSIIQGHNKVIDSIRCELERYFKKSITEFNTPFHFLGTPFQKSVWQKLLDVPYGETRSYGYQARAMDRHKAYRAVANANGANQICIVIPCHRIINSNGDIGGYSSGVKRKKWLIRHENMVST